MRRLFQCPGASLNLAIRLNDILAFHDGSLLISGVSYILELKTKARRGLLIIVIFQEWYKIEIIVHSNANSRSTGLNILYCLTQLAP